LWVRDPQPIFFTIYQMSSPAQPVPVRLGIAQKCGEASGGHGEGSTPGTFKTPTVQLAQASEHSLSIVPLPTLPRASHSVMNDGVDAALHRSTADRIAFCPKTIIMHAVLN
jgi:hypothetical protein